MATAMFTKTENIQHSTWLTHESQSYTFNITVGTRITLCKQHISAITVTHENVVKVEWQIKFLKVSES
jgi:hypothetical protein